MGLLRFLLALSVVVAHAGPIFGFKPLGGVEAVQSFFMISGFYMALILNEKYLGAGSYKTFIQNRFLRIYPIYFLTLAATAIFSASLYLRHGNGPFAFLARLRPASFVIVGLSNLFIYGQDTVLFLGEGANGGPHFVTDLAKASEPLHFGLLLPPAWSLGVELTFYLVAPLIVRRGMYFLLAGMTASLLLRGYFYFGLNLAHDPWTYRFFPTELAFFLAGAVAYKIYARRTNDEGRSPAALLLSGTLFLSYFSYQFLSEWAMHGLMVKQWAFYLVVWMSIPSLFLLTKNSKADRLIGELSYPIYITHFLVILVLLSPLARFGAGSASSSVVTIVTILVSAAVTWAVAQPMEKIRQRRARTRLR